MKFSTKTRYGIRAMLEIALCTNENGIFQKDISINQDISNKYLDHIIYGLKVAGLVTTSRGRKSGYVLTRPARQISLLDIYNAFEPGIYVVDCMRKKDACKRAANCAARNFWHKLNEQTRKIFLNTMLEDLVKEHKKMNKKA
jgi:Rrf2 family protein